MSFVLQGYGLPRGVLIAGGLGLVGSTTNQITPSGIYSTQHGELTVISVYQITPSGIYSTQQGSHLVTSVYQITPSGIYSTQQGTPLITSVYQITPSGIISTNEYGDPLFVSVNQIAPGGIYSTQQGTPLVTSVYQIITSGIASTDEYGEPVVVNVNRITPSGIYSTQHGEPRQSNIATISPMGIISPSGYGIPIQTNRYYITATGISSLLQLGGVDLTHVVKTYGIRDTRFGTLRARGYYDILGEGITSSTGLGNPELRDHTDLSGFSSSQIGTPSLENSNLFYPNSISNEFRVGSPTGGTGIVLSGIPSQIQHGTFIEESEIRHRGISNPVQMGYFTRSGEYDTSPVGIAGTSRFGTFTTTIKISHEGLRSTIMGSLDMIGNNPVNPLGISNGTRLGYHMAVPGTVTIDPSGISTGNMFGNPDFLPGEVLLDPDGILGTAYGSHTALPGEVGIFPGGFTTGNQIGSHVARNWPQTPRERWVYANATDRGVKAQPTPVRETNVDTVSERTIVPLEIIRNITTYPDLERIAYSTPQERIFIVLDDGERLFEGANRGEFTITAEADGDREIIVPATSERSIEPNSEPRTVKV